ncbi:MAG: polysaccharide biosynthesis C-terminal domain-containing protein [Bacteroidales bacterium]|nr:polysaccharide biosynthesis C-terminal domain-containing protein [Bacteroidales bacterium]
MFFKVNSTSSLQIYQILRYSAILIVNILLSKTYLSLDELGQLETFLFYFSLVSFFWINGFIQSILANYKSNNDNKQLIFFNSFIVLLVFSFISAFFLFFFLDNYQSNTDVYSKFKLFLFIYTLINPVSFLIEYILLLKSRFKHLIYYGVYSLIIQIILVVLPVFLFHNFYLCFYGLIIFASLKLLLLIILLKKHSVFKFSKVIVFNHLKFSIPLIITSFIAGSESYIDGFIISYKFDSQTFAIFRYGAKEFPLFLLLANAISNSMIAEFSSPKSVPKALNELKLQSKKIIELFLPIVLLLLATSHILFPLVFNKYFTESYKIFDIYLLLIISRTVFPQTILIGLKKTKTIAYISILEMLINIISSLILIQFYGILGVAYGTVIAFFSEKLLLVISLKRKLNINLTEYLDKKLFFILLLSVFFIFIIKLFIL